MRSSPSAISKVINAFFLTLFLPATSFAGGDETPPAREEKKFVEIETGGEVKLFGFLDTEDNNPLENTAFGFGRLDVKNDVTFPGEDISLHFSSRLDFRATSDGINDDDAEASLEECYVKLKKEGYSLFIGRQYVSWGKLDDFVILDQINPQDYGLFVLLDKQERKEAALMLRLDRQSESYRLEGIYLPVFKPSSLRFFGSDWALFDRLHDGVESGPYPESAKAAVRRIRIMEKDRFTEKTPAGGQAGIRLSGRAADNDYGLYYLYIYSRIPALREKTPGGNTLKRFLYLPTDENLTAWVNSNPSGDDFILEREHERTHVVGLDFETVIGAFGLRGEFGAFLEMPYLKDDFSYTAKDTLSLGVGIDHTTENNLYANFQFIEDIVLDYESLFAQEEYTHTVTANLKGDFFRGRLFPEIDAAVNVSRGDWLLNPAVAYKTGPGVSFTLGAFLFDGDSTTVFGRFSGKDLVFLKVSGKF